jgi:hypothetical protein
MYRCRIVPITFSPYVEVGVKMFSVSMNVCITDELDVTTGFIRNYSDSWKTLAKYNSSDMCTSISTEHWFYAQWF